MAHSIFGTLAGVTLEGSSPLTVQQLLDTPPSFIQPAVSRSSFTSAISRGLSQHPEFENILDDDDVFQCGKCKEQFSNLDRFMLHKRSQCTASGKCLSLPTLKPAVHSTEECNTLHITENGAASLSNGIHVQVQSSSSQVSTNYNNCDLTTTEDLGQHIIVNEAELLNFTIEADQTCGGTGLTEGAYLINGSDHSKALPSTVTSLLTTTPSVTTLLTTSLEVTPSITPLSPESMVTDVVPSSTPREGSNVHLKLVEMPSSVKEKMSSYNHDFFHGGMAKTSPTKVEAKHRTIHKCQFCSKEFSKNFDLQQHIRSHTGEKPFQCVVCGRAFAQKSNVKKHMAKHRVWPQGTIRNTLPKDPLWVLNDSAEESENNNEQSNKSILVDNSYACQLCDARFTQYKMLRAHMKVHNDHKVYKCIQKNCSRTFPELEPFLQHIKSHDKDLEYHCHTCSKIFNSLKELGEHHFEHSINPLPKKKHGPSYYRCTKCMNKYSSREALEHHLKTSSHYFPCKHCSKIFTTERLLRRHLNLHGTVNVSTCSECGKEFKSEYSMKLHQLIHTGEKPHECQICGSAFNRRDKLRRHMLIHGAKKFKCPFKDILNCTREFTRADKLKLHINTHVNNRWKGKTKSTSATTTATTTTSTSTSTSTRPVKGKMLNKKDSYFCLSCKQTVIENETHECKKEEQESHHSLASPPQEPEEVTNITNISSSDFTEDDTPVKLNTLKLEDKSIGNDKVSLHNFESLIKSEPDTACIKVESPLFSVQTSNQQTSPIKQQKVSPILDLNSDKIISCAVPSFPNVTISSEPYISEQFDSEGGSSECIVSNSYHDNSSNQLQAINYTDNCDKNRFQDSLSTSRTIGNDSVCNTITGLSEDGKNVEIIYIPFSFERSLDSHLMMAMSQESCDLPQDLDENEATTITLDETNQSLLVSPSTIDNLGCDNSLVTMDTNSILKDQQPLQVIINSNGSQVTMNNEHVLKSSEIDGVTSCTSSSNSLGNNCITSIDNNNSNTQDSEDVFSEGIEVLCW